MPEIEYVYAKTGSNDRGAEDQIGSLTLNYIDWQQRRPAVEILAEIRVMTAALALGVASFLTGASWLIGRRNKLANERTRAAEQAEQTRAAAEED